MLTYAWPKEDAYRAFVAWAGFRELTWTKPVRPSDTLQVKSEILEIIPSQSKPDRGMVLVKLTTTNQNGEVVQTFSPKLVVFRRPAK